MKKTGNEVRPYLRSLWNPISIVLITLGAGGAVYQNDAYKQQKELEVQLDRDSLSVDNQERLEAQAYSKISKDFSNAVLNKEPVTDVTSQTALEEKKKEVMQEWKTSVRSNIEHHNFMRFGIPVVCLALALGYGIDRPSSQTHDSSDTQNNHYTYGI